MNELSKIRTYFNAQIKKVDRDFKEHKDAFNDENIAGTVFNKAFHIAYSVPSIATVEQTAELGSTVTVQLFFKGGRDTLETYDNAMNKAWTVLREVASRTNMNQFRITDQYPIQSVEPTSLEPEALENNDNSMVVTMAFDCLIITTIC